jgi:hypothetical protein
MTKSNHKRSSQTARTKAVAQSFGVIPIAVCQLQSFTVKIMQNCAMLSRMHTSLSTILKRRSQDTHVIFNKSDERLPKIEANIYLANFVSSSSHRSFVFIFIFRLVIPVPVPVLVVVSSRCPLYGDVVDASTSGKPPLPAPRQCLPLACPARRREDG